MVSTGNSANIVQKLVSNSIQMIEAKLDYAVKQGYFAQEDRKKMIKTIIERLTIHRVGIIEESIGRLDVKNEKDLILVINNQIDVIITEYKFWVVISMPTMINRTIYYELYFKFINQILRKITINKSKQNKLFTQNNFDVIIHDVIIKFLNRKLAYVVEKYDPSIPLTTYLYVIFKNLILDALKADNNGSTNIELISIEDNNVFLINTTKYSYDYMN
jgi:hypothetical protein